MRVTNRSVLHPPLLPCKVSVLPTLVQKGSAPEAWSIVKVGCNPRSTRLLTPWHPIRIPSARVVARHVEAPARHCEARPRAKGVPPPLGRHGLLAGLPGSRNGVLAPGGSQKSGEIGRRQETPCAKAWRPIRAQPAHPSPQSPRRRHPLPRRPRIAWTSARSEALPSPSMARLCEPRAGRRSAKRARLYDPAATGWRHQHAPCDGMAEVDGVTEVTDLTAG